MSILNIVVHISPTESFISSIEVLENVCQRRNIIFDHTLGHKKCRRWLTAPLFSVNVDQTALFQLVYVHQTALFYLVDVDHCLFQPCQRPFSSRPQIKLWQTLEKYSLTLSRVIFFTKLFNYIGSLSPIPFKNIQIKTIFCWSEGGANNANYDFRPLLIFVELL